jgi:dihydroorotate dehydrogenase
MLIIGPPAGNYLSWPDTLSTLGTYTFQKRPGRFWRILKTVRYHWRLQAWTNKIGLRNPGIKALVEKLSKSTNTRNMRKHILSIHGFSLSDWMLICDTVKSLPFKAFELNISCPNIDNQDQYDTRDVYSLVTQYIQPDRIIVKLGPIGYLDEIEKFSKFGITTVHLCNTLPVPCGGLSGKPLMLLSLIAIAETKAYFPQMVIIGGGGITSIRDVRKYQDAGAKHCSVMSMLFNPFNWSKIPKMAEELKSSEF